MKFRKDYNHDAENIFDACGFDEDEFMEFNKTAMMGIIRENAEVSQWIEELDKIMGESDIYRRWIAIALIFFVCEKKFGMNWRANETIH
jgi:hypothetical protein